MDKAGCPWDAICFPDSVISDIWILAARNILFLNYTNNRKSWSPWGISISKKCFQAKIWNRARDLKIDFRSSDHERITRRWINISRKNLLVVCKVCLKTIILRDNAIRKHWWTINNKPICENARINYIFCWERHR